MHSCLIFKQENPSLEAQVKGTPTIPPTYIRVRAVVWECGEGHTHTHTNAQTRVTNLHFASATPHAKRNNQDIKLDRDRCNDASTITAGVRPAAVLWPGGVCLRRRSNLESGICTRHVAGDRATADRQTDTCLNRGAYASHVAVLAALQQHPERRAKIYDQRAAAEDIFRLTCRRRRRKHRGNRQCTEARQSRHVIVFQYPYQIPADVCGSDE